MQWYETVKKVFTNTNKFFSKLKTKGGYSEPVKFAAINFAIGGLLSGILIGAGLARNQFARYGIDNIAAVPLSILDSIVGGIIGIFVGGIIFFLMMKMLGGKGTYEATVRVLSYASVVSLVSWIAGLASAFGFVTLLYAIYLNTIGFSHVHKISKLRAFLGVVVPFLIIVGILAILFGIGGLDLPY